MSRRGGFQSGITELPSCGVDFDMEMISFAGR